MKCSQTECQEESFKEIEVLVNVNGFNQVHKINICKAHLLEQYKIELSNIDKKKMRLEINISELE